jgi:heat shock protein HslJ
MFTYYSAKARQNQILREAKQARLAGATTQAKGTARSQKRPHRFFLITIAVLAACTCSGATALENTAWELESLSGNAVLPGTTITLEFSDDQISGSAGCNHYGGSYRAGENILHVSDLFWTEMGCLEPEGIMEQEQAYLAALNAAAKYQIGDGKLEIRDEAGAQVLVFVAPGSKALAEEETPTRTAWFKLD